MDVERIKQIAGINESAEEEFAKARAAKQAAEDDAWVASKGKGVTANELAAKARADKRRAEEEMWVASKGTKKVEGMESILRTAGIDAEPIIESVEEEADTFIVFEAKGSPNVVGVFRSAEDAKTVMKKYKKAVGKAYRSK